MPNEDALEKIIHNCHVHTFTIDHVPRGLIPKSLGWLMGRRFLQTVLIRAIRHLARLLHRPLWDRYANFLATTAGKDQRAVFDLLQARYKRGTRFVVLPMDLEQMGHGPAAQGLDRQHAELLRLRADFPDAVFPFYAVDPRRPGVADGLKRAFDAGGFFGIKLYPNLGYAPDHRGLAKVWEFADDRRLPVMTHCSRGGMHGYDADAKAWLDEASSERYGAPRLYEPILKRHPNLRLCLAHLGGQVEWNRFLQNPWYVGGQPQVKRSWLSDILDMLKEYPNLYTDISYTVFYFQEFVPALKRLAAN